ncbi:hypothetical protein [Novosphingobium naphthalenivorans]|uniref:hypothetical protein n=1 Tax=Novosphingobium naphthalenivorans TaxID=273168 RepID=UPI000AAE13F8|nr:hypothetical protein [Novosphingobium naphthalenivorans]
MDVTPNNLDSMNLTGMAAGGQECAPCEPESAGTLGLKWSALHDAADVVAAIAGADTGPRPAGIRDFPAAIRSAGNSRRAMAEQGIEDLSALMEAGLAALLSAIGHGTEPHGAAKALWREFNAARDAVLDLAPAGPGDPCQVA